MMRRLFSAWLTGALAFAAPLWAESQEAEELRPITMQDSLDWKSIRSTALSDDGAWFVYHLSPNEGDSEVIVRSTKSDTEHRFDVGDLSNPRIEISDNSEWVAFSIAPDFKEGKKLKKDKKPLRNKVALVEMDSGEKTEFENGRASSFSGETGAWLVVHKYKPEDADKDGPKGTDLVLYELSTGNRMTVGNVSEFAFDKSGEWLAWAVDANDKSDNGVQIRKMSTGAISPLDSGEASYERVTWNEEGGGLAVLKGIDDEDYEEPLYSVVGFTQSFSTPFKKTVYDPREDESFPEGMTVSPNRNPMWTDDLTGILFGIHDVDMKEDSEAAEEEQGEQEEEEPAEEETGESEEDAEEDGEEKESGDKDDEDEERADLVVWHYKDKRLQSQQQVQESRDEDFSYLSIYRVNEDKFIRLADDDVRRVSADPGHRWAVGRENGPYELAGSLNGQRFEDIYAVDLLTGGRHLAVEKVRWSFSPSPDGRHLLYYRDGHYRAYEMATREDRSITENVPMSFIDTEDDHNIVDPPIRPIGWVKGGRSVLLSDNWDLWQVDIEGGEGTNLTVNGREEGIRYRRRFRLDEDEEGIDLAKDFYISAYGEYTKESGIGQLSGGEQGVSMLLWEDAVLGRLMKAEDADTFLFARQTQSQTPAFHVAGADLQSGDAITDANPQQAEMLWSDGAQLVDYTSARGDKLQAALFLPANYEPGKSYPAIVYIYEKLTQGYNRYVVPTAYGFNKSVYTSNGYAVLMPDIAYRVDDPGNSAVWCVIPAVEAAIATGVVDRERIGIHGHSWGGYQTSFLITQSPIFRAAVAGAPLTNLISMYSSVYWNTGGVNGAIFESSQGRFRGAPWDDIDAYARNSPVYFAKNVETPLLIMHNDKDGAVDWNQGIEYYNTLRRLGKPVVMLQYKGENHGLVKQPNRKDYTVRVRQFFDHHLKGAEAPEWLLEGVPHLDMEEHLDELSLVRR